MHNKSNNSFHLFFITFRSKRNVMTRSALQHLNNVSSSATLRKSLHLETQSTCKAGPAVDCQVIESKALTSGGPDITWPEPTERHRQALFRYCSTIFRHQMNSSQIVFDQIYARMRNIHMHASRTHTHIYIYLGSVQTANIVKARCVEW